MPTSYFLFPTSYNIARKEKGAMAAIVSRPSRISPLRRRRALAGYLFVLPWIISLLVFTAYPVLASFYFSLTDYTVVEAPRWVGLENYRSLSSTDPSFWISVYNSAYYALISVPVSLIVSLGLALLLNMQAKGIGIYRTLFYLPALAPPVAGTIIFIIMFNYLYYHVQFAGRTGESDVGTGGAIRRGLVYGSQMGQVGLDYP
jgi:ABC-type sugar transport system permease subunit